MWAEFEVTENESLEYLASKLKELGYEPSNGVFKDGSVSVNVKDSEEFNFLLNELYSKTLNTKNEIDVQLIKEEISLIDKQVI